MATVVTFSPDVRVTEAPNPFTADLDVAPTDAAVVRLFGASDAMMFSGFGGLPHLSSPECIAALHALVDALAVALYQPNGRVVFAGCGTSGRLSHFLARGLNAWAAAQLGHTQPRFHYLLAGGDAALLLPQEAVEDQPHAGVDDLERWEAAAGAAPLHPVVVVGISCGLSATYVGSMLAAAVKRPGYTAVCVGFNPIEAVRSVRVDGWGSSFFEVLQEMCLGPAATRCIVLNPVLGPETIAGSSRMKGGSATTVLLETACVLTSLVAGGRVPGASAPGAVPALLIDALMQFEAAARCLYATCSEGLGDLLQAGGRALTTPVAPPLVDGAGAPAAAADGAVAASAVDPAPPRRFVSPTLRGRIIYLGVGAAGLLGLIDASECTPTYGSHFNDVRGFVAGGWAAVGAACGAGGVTLPMPRHLRGDGALPTAATPEEVALDVGAFRADFVPTLTAADLVVLVYIHEPAGGAAGTAAAAGTPVSSPRGAVASTVGGGGGVGSGDAPLDEALGALAAAAAAGAQVAHIVVLGADSDDDGAVAAGGGGGGATPSRSAAATAAAATPTRLSGAPSATSAPPTPAAPRGTDAVLARVRAVAPRGVALRLPSVRLAWDLHSTSRAAAAAAPIAAAVAPFTSRAPPSLGQFALKLALNVVTTGAHVRTGAIFGNRMVAVAITNQKLFHRAVGIVADVSGLPRPAAEACLLRAVYRRDDDDAPAAAAALGRGAAPAAAEAAARLSLAQLATLPTSAHVAAGSAQPGLVPLAILLAIDAARRQAHAPAAGGRGRGAAGSARAPPLRVADAAARLRRQPVVRKALLELMAEEGGETA